MTYIFRFFRTVFGTVRGIYRPLKDLAYRAIRSFSPTAKITFGILCLMALVSGIVLIAQIDRKISIRVPGFGGEIVEGVIGAPKIVNPILEQTGTTRDIATLVFVGLVAKSPEGGYEPLLAEKFEAIGAQGLETTATSSPRITYRFTINSKARFHDKSAVTAEDVIFTIARIKDGSVKSPLASDYALADFTAIDTYTVDMTVPSTLSDPLSLATVGIMPRTRYEAIPPQDFSLAEYHVTPIGAGPYMIGDITRDNSGIPTSYRLNAFKDFVRGEPYIATIRFSFFKNETDLVAAYEAGDITSVGGISPERAQNIEKLAEARNQSYWQSSDTDTYGGDQAHTVRSVLPRQFVVFINQQKNPALAEAPVRIALNETLPRQALIDTVLSGYGTPVFSPIPEHLGRSVIAQSATTTGPESIFSPLATTSPESALEKAGYKLNEEGKRVKTLANKNTEALTLSLVTANTPDLATAAQIIKTAWESLGITVDVKLYEPGDLNQNIIRKRDYDLLLFGQVVSRDSDLFAFWHTSRRLDPGLNISQYTNSTVDRALEKLIRPQPLTAEEKLATYQTIHNEITRDIPALFLYAPEYLYVSPVRYISDRHETFESPSERFIGIDRAYVTTERVWPIFLPWYIK